MPEQRRAAERAAAKVKRDMVLLLFVVFRS
jgi:hypothetical protein